MKILNRLILLPFLSCRIAAEVISVTKQIHGEGTIRYHYDAAAVTSPCDTVLVLGVGTAMSVSDYDLISREIVATAKVMTVVVDPEPDWFIKTSAERFAKLANAMIAQVDNIISVCSSVPEIVIVGGHSAGGQAAMEAIRLFDFDTKGYLGLDPYEIDTNTDHQNVPALFWGFAETTCGVDVSKAAKAGYSISDESHRVLYQIQHNIDSHVTHCIFTDRGCCACPDSMSFDQQEHLLRLVGESTQRFVQAIRSGRFSKANFELKKTEEEASMVRLFANQDSVENAEASSLETRETM